MSGYLWKYYFEDDVDSFRHVLESAAHTSRTGAPKGLAGRSGGAYGVGLNSNPGSYGASPLLGAKGRKMPTTAALTLTRSDINSRDGMGMTILHHAASSTAENAIGFAQGLLEHPLVDLYVQDAENGWTPLHRAFYFGNIAIARLILNRDTQDMLGHGSIGFNQNARGLVKIKDKEGYGPLDLFSLTIKDRTLRPEVRTTADTDSDDEIAQGDSGDRVDDSRRRLIAPLILLDGDEVYTFGSNKNVTLGFGDQDDRQFPERIVLRRPDHLLQRFYWDHRETELQKMAAMNLGVQDAGPLQPLAVTDLPTHIRNTPLVVQDVQMSKLHTAVLTTDPVSNLYVCGHGPGGRLGIGTETTRYQFTCVESGGLGKKKIAAVALGQNHTLAVTDEGEIFSWGNNAYGQLGYSLPKPAVKDDDPISTIPRQIFGPLKRDAITGIAASRIHSVAHTSTSLYTFGKNEGQLGIVDSDARSLEMQIIPRKIAASLFSSPISSASAIDGATICLLENREVWVFANYGYARLNFPLDGFTNSFLKESWLTTKYDTTPNKVKKITSGGDTICALSSSGEVFTVAVSRRTEGGQDANTSTTNPKQIRDALSQPYRIWSAKQGHMAARDVDVDQDGSIILTTEAGSVWRRTKRATIKNTTGTGTVEQKPKDYKFQRVSGLTRVTAVRASAFGAYAAIRKDCDVTKTQIGVGEPTLWEHVAPLLPFYDLSNYEEDSNDENPLPRFWQRPEAQSLRKRVLESKNLEKDVTEILERTLRSSENTYDIQVGTTLSDVRIPAHEFIMSSRSRVFREAMASFRAQDAHEFSVAELLDIRELDGRVTVIFHGVDFLTLFDLVLYSYTDTLVDFWNVTRYYPKMAYRYRTVRTELMKLASQLDLRQLEPAVRLMVNPRRSLNLDMALAVKDISLFDSGDMVVELTDGEMTLHSDILCQRCPFFEGLFRGRAGGQWLASRRTEESQLVRIDLTHVEVHLFELVVRHLYTDAGEELFDDVTSEDLNDLLALDELLDHVMAVMSVANELMLDRLSQICQKLIGRYVNARNVCSLLAAIAPSSVSEFKDAALEYVCLSMEAVMQNGSLDELDEDLLSELNHVVRENQLAYLPFARSGRAEALLFDKYPELAERIEQGKRARIDAIVLSNKFSEVDGPLSTSFRAQSLEELSVSPLRQRNRRRASREGKLEAESPAATPALKAKSSVADLMFEMSDGDDDQDLGGAIRQPQFTQVAVKQPVNDSIGSPESPWSDARKEVGQSPLGASLDMYPILGSQSSKPSQTDPERIPGRPWGPAPLAATKLDLKDIMAQTSSGMPSNLTLGLSQQEKERKTSGSFHAKMSQKERKRIQQAHQLGQPVTVEGAQPVPPTISPWQAKAMSHPKASDSLGVTPPPPAQSARTSSTPQLTMRQTVANRGAESKQKEQDKGRQPSQSNPGNTASSQKLTSIAADPSGRGMSVSTTPISTPQSVRHMPLPSHSPTSPSQHMTMHEILSLQQAEKDYLREAAAKRSLQEIQQEQEFQAWWDQESKRVIQEEEQRKRAEERATKASRGRGRGRGSKPKGKGKNKKEGEETERIKATKDVNPGPAVAEASTSTPPTKHDGADKGKSRGRGQRGVRGGGRGGRQQGTPREPSAPAASVTPKQWVGAA